MNNSKEHIEYLKKLKHTKRIIIFFQILIIVALLIIWQILSSFNIINSFLSSSPKDILSTIVKLFKDKILFKHIFITLYETLISFSITYLLGFIVAAIMWLFPKFSKIIDPYLTVINALPKVALGPLIIIWIGASTSSIIFMAFLISFFITVINIYNGFTSTNKNYIILLKSFKATKRDIFFKVIIPSNKKNLISCAKINISMTLIGIIMGELLVSKEGLGYLIMYGSQVFNINLVITSVFILGIIAFVMYKIVTKIEKIN